MLVGLAGLTRLAALSLGSLAVLGGGSIVAVSLQTLKEISFPFRLDPPNVLSLQAFNGLSHQLLGSIDHAELDIHGHVFDYWLEARLVNAKQRLDNPECLVVVSGAFGDLLIRGRVVLRVAEHDVVEQGTVRGQEPHSELEGLAVPKLGLLRALLNAEVFELRDFLLQLDQKAQLRAEAEVADDQVRDALQEVVPV